MFKNRVRSPDVLKQLLFLLCTTERTSVVAGYTYSVVCVYIYIGTARRVIYYYFFICIGMLALYTYTKRVLMVTLNRHILHIIIIYAYSARTYSLHGLINIEWIYVRTHHACLFIYYIYIVLLRWRRYIIYRVEGIKYRKKKLERNRTLHSACVIEFNYLERLIFRFRSFRTNHHGIRSHTRARARTAHVIIIILYERNVH